MSSSRSQSAHTRRAIRKRRLPRARDVSPATDSAPPHQQLRKQTGVTIIAVVRGGQPLTNPEPDLQIQSGDILVMVGDHAQLDLALAQLGDVPATEAPPA